MVLQHSLKLKLGTKASHNTIVGFQVSGFRCQERTTEDRYLNSEVGIWKWEFGSRTRRRPIGRDYAAASMRKWEKSTQRAKSIARWQIDGMRKLASEMVKHRAQVEIGVSPAAGHGRASLIEK